VTFSRKGSRRHGDVIVADKCYFLLREISDDANVINGRNFGTFFSFLQDTLLPQYTLTLARLFENPARYPIRGIPATIDFLEANRADIPVESRQFMIDELKLTGTDGLSDPDLTSMVAQVIRARLPNAQATKLFDALDAIKTRRDKTVAHNEVVDPEDMPPVTWGRTQELSNWPRRLSP